MKSGLARVAFLVVMFAATTTLAAEKRKHKKILPDTISMHVIADVFRDHVYDLRICAYKHLRSNPSVTGTMLLSLKIGRSGRIRDVLLLTKEHRGTYVHRCVLGTLKKLKFPKFRGDPIPIPRIPIRIEGPKVEGDREPVFSIQDLCPAKTENDRKEYVVDEDPVMPCDLVVSPRNIDVIGVMRRHLPEFRECTREHVAIKDSARGRMMIGFVIDPSGEVTKVRVKTAIFRGTHVGRCISKIVSKLKFFKFTGKPKEVSFPFTVK